MEQVSEFDLSDRNSAVKDYRYAEKDVNITECLNRHVDAISNCSPRGKIAGGGIFIPEKGSNGR